MKLIDSEYSFPNYEGFFCLFLGRKFPLRRLREKLMKKLKPYMRVLPDKFYQTASAEDLKIECKRLCIDENTSREELKEFNRKRMFACWHDTSAISNASHFLVLFNCLYDEALFYTNDEYLQKTGIKLCHKKSLFNLK